MRSALLFTATLIVAFAVASAEEYTVRDLGKTLRPQAINEAGVVAGVIVSGDPPRNEPFILIGDEVWQIPVGYGSVGDMASDGTVVGQVRWDDPHLPTQPYIYDPDAGLTFIPLEQTIGAAVAVNDAGTVGGYLQEPGGFGWGHTFPFLFVDGEVIRLPEFGPGGSVTAINASGLAVGTSGGHAVAWSGFDATILPALAAGYSSANDVNDVGDIVGLSTSSTIGPFGFPVAQPVKWSDGVVLDLGTLDDAQDGAARAINSVGAVVGQFWTISRGVAFLHRDGVLRTLDEVAASTGWAFWAAEAINDAGQIVGFGIPPGGEPFEFHGFILSPDPATPETLIARLNETIDAGGLDPGLATSLKAKLAAARDGLEAGSVKSACNQIGAFINQLAAQSGKKITEAQSAEMIEIADRILELLEC